MNYKCVFKGSLTLIRNDFIFLSTSPPFKQKDNFHFSKDLIWVAFLIVTGETDGKHGERRGDMQ